MIEVEMTSLEIEELTGKKHRSVLRDIRGMLDRDNSLFRYCKETTYKNSRGKYYPLFIVRGKLLDFFKTKIIFNRSIQFGRVQQEAALGTIEQIKNINLDREYLIPHSKGYYMIDGYDCVNNTAYEIDEKHHKYQQKRDIIRQRYIEKVLGCNFVRIKV